MQNILNIVHLIYDDPQNPWCGGGGAIRTHEINRRLAVRHKITAITGKWQGAKDEVKDGVHYVRIGSSRNYAISRLSYALRAHRILRNYPCDLLINDFSGYSPVFPRLLVDSPIITVKHHIMGRHSFGKNPLLGIFPFLFEKIDLRLSKNFVSVSPGLTQYLQKRYPGKKRIQTIFNGISPELFKIESEEEPFVLFIGRMDVYMKGLDILINAFAKIADQSVVLKIAGISKPNDKETLISQAARLGISSRVQFLGFVDETTKQELLRKCLFVCMPSRFEGWGIVAIESAAARKAVIGTRISGLSDAIIHEKTGILVSPENDNELAAAIDRLIDDPELRRTMGIAGQAWARQFNWDEIAKKQEMYYYLVVSDQKKG